MMVVRCPDCQAEYDVEAAPGVEVGTKVRCPRCRGVFPILPRGASADPGAIPYPRRPSRPRVSDPVLARRMARAMVSEMVLNRQRERDEAVASGHALSAFGSAIATAYRLYGEKVAPEMESSRRIFREALNEILGGGKPIL